MAGDSAIRVFGKPQFQHAFMVVTWNQDAASLGSGIADFLLTELSADSFADLDPSEFFPLGGVAVEDDVAVFPETKFYRCNDNLAVVTGTPPGSEWYRFLNSILDVGRDYCHVLELYVLGGMVSLGAHLDPRAMLGIASSPDMKQVLNQHGVSSQINFETPAGQRPTLNSFLLWASRRRNIPAATLWVPVPFYLVAHEDPQAEKKILEFLNTRLGLGLDFRPLDDRIADQNRKIAAARQASPEIDGLIQRLEKGAGLTEEDSEKLIKAMDECLREES